ncbi:MAG: hypothetical protein ACREAC_25070, partial [Blastocatellia bacterium]
TMLGRENPYLQDSNSSARTTRSIAVFLDVLGFSGRIVQAYKDNSDSTLLRDLRSALTSAGEAFAAPYPSFTEDRMIGFTQIKQADFWHIKSFTDNIVIGCPISTDNADGEAELGGLIVSLRWYQLEMVRRGFFVRGGIAVGELYMDEDIVFGDALLEAYKIESKIARDPRIVLSPKVEPLIERHLEFYAETAESPHIHTLLRDSDEQLFVNYLGAALDENPEDPDFHAMEAHQESVVSMLNNHKADPAIWAKYAWVANYHNFICDEQGSQLERYKIDPSLLRLVPRRMT